MEPGIYHVHTQLNIAGVGPGLGPGQTVQVIGEPILKPIPMEQYHISKHYNCCRPWNYFCYQTVASNLKTFLYIFNIKFNTISFILLGLYILKYS